MYKTGGEFKYDLMGTYMGSHRCKLNGLEYRAKDLIMEMNQHKNNVNLMKVQSDNMKCEFNDTYKKLRKDVSDEVCDFEMNFNLKFNQQKVKNSEINKEMEKKGKSKDSKQLQKNVFGKRNTLLENIEDYYGVSLIK